MKLIAKASIQISRSAETVFEAIVNPEHMTRYFISESSGRMETGKELSWKFPEFPEVFTVKKILAEKARMVSFVWDEATVVRIKLEQQADRSTVVSVSEEGKVNNEENIKWVIGNTEGWANFLACMKAYLEYGVELRKGAFDFLKKS